MPQMWFGPVMARTMIEEGHGVKGPEMRGFGVKHQEMALMLSPTGLPDPQTLIPDPEHLTLN
jgi:hypothetical protein